MHSVEGTFTTCININAPDQSSSCHIFLECWWRKLAKNQRSLPAFFLGPKAHVHDPVHVLLVGLNHMHGPMQNFLVCFGAPKLYAFPLCKCYAFLNILLGYPLCLTTTHKNRQIVATVQKRSWKQIDMPVLGLAGCHGRKWKLVQVRRLASQSVSPDQMGVFVGSGPKWSAATPCSKMDIEVENGSWGWQSITKRKTKTKRTAKIVIIR